MEGCQYFDSPFCIFAAMRISLLFLALVLVSLLSAQPKVRFDARSNYVGSFKPGAGSIESTFVFTNKESEVIQISGIHNGNAVRVLGSSRGPVRPGGRGFISLRFQLPETSGRFMETITVYFDPKLEHGIDLIINGEMLPPEKTLADDFPFLIGDIRLKSPSLDLGRFLNSEKVNREFVVLNAGNVPLDYRISGSIMHMDAYFTPAIIHPGETARLFISYNAARKTGFGPLHDTLVMFSNMSDETPLRIPLEVYLEEDFSKLKQDQIDVAPKVSFTNTNHEFGAVTAGTQVVHTFYIKNRGKRQLQIRNVVSSSPYLDFELGSTRVRFQQEVELKVSYNAIDKPGPFLEKLTLICNDPSRPEINVYVQGAVIN